MSRIRQRGRTSEPRVRAVAMTYPAGFVLDAHKHAWTQLLYASSGVMLVEAAAGMWIVPPQRAVWVPAGVAHTISMHGSVEKRTVYFRDRAALPLEETTVIEVSPLLRELLVHCAMLGRLDERVGFERRLAGLLVDLVAAAPRSLFRLPMPTDPRAVRVAQAIRQDPGGRETTAMLAKKAATSGRTLERLFLSDTGMSVGAWRKQARLHHAIALLTSDAPVTTVALEVGYSSPSAFIATFKAAFGTTPSRFLAGG
jgi:AraC-like DNA-binding protein